MRARDSRAAFTYVFGGLRYLEGCDDTNKFRYILSYFVILIKVFSSTFRNFYKR